MDWIIFQITNSPVQHRAQVAADNSSLQSQSRLVHTIAADAYVGFKIHNDAPEEEKEWEMITLNQ